MHERRPPLSFPSPLPSSPFPSLTYLEYNELADGLEDGSAVENGFRNRKEIVVQNDDICRLLRNLRARAHSESYIRFLQSRRVIHTIP